MLSDLYLPYYLNPSSPNLNNLICNNFDIDSLSNPCNEEFIFSINIHCLGLPPSNYLLFIAWCK